MRGLAIALSVLLVFLLSIQAQELQLAIQKGANQTFSLSISSPPVSQGHTFIEFSTNRLWFPAYFISSNSTGGRVYSATNAGGMRMFRATQSPTIAHQVKASWQRLGVTNYIFHYSEQCLCGDLSMTSATVTVMSNKVVKVENAKNRNGDPIANPSLSIPRTVEDLLDVWISSEPNGGSARELDFNISGFPTVIFIDPDPRLADEELSYTIDSFTALP